MEKLNNTNILKCKNTVNFKKKREKLKNTGVDLYQGHDPFSYKVS